MTACSKCQQRCWAFQSEGEWHAPSYELLAWGRPHAGTTTVGHYGGMERFTHKGGLRFDSLVHHVDWAMGFWVWDERQAWLVLEQHKVGSSKHCYQSPGDSTESWFASRSEQNNSVMWMSLWWKWLVSVVVIWFWFCVLRKLTNFFCRVTWEGEELFFFCCHRDTLLIEVVVNFLYTN